MASPKCVPRDRSFEGYIEMRDSNVPLLSHLLRKRFDIIFNLVRVTRCGSRFDFCKIKEDFEMILNEWRKLI